MTDQALAEEQDLAFYLPEGWDSKSLKTIERIILRQFDEACPPFVQAWYGDRYREFASDPLWLAHSFIANAEKEAEGSRKLYSIAASAKAHDFAEEIWVHAADEARHARMYMGMLQILFPHALADAERREIIDGFPKHQDEVARNAETEAADLHHLIDQLVQMNIGEIRTRLHQMLLRPVAMAYCPPTAKRRLSGSLERIYEDEGKHIL